MKVGRIEFSPGPWRKGDHPFDIVADKYHVVATVAHDRQGLNRGREESEANARLIVAAPELLALLKEVALAFEDIPPPANWAERARAAIRKAEGTADAAISTLGEHAAAKAEAGAL